MVGQPVCAQQPAPLHYQVRVEAPRELQQMLERGLDLVRWQDDPQMTPELLHRLVNEAVDQTRRAIATEGYFNPQVGTHIDEATTPWTVAIKVEPGPRTIVDSVTITFSGPASEDPAAHARLARIRSEWQLPRGEPFRQSAWDGAKRSAVHELAEWRYASAHVARSEARIDPDTQRAALSVEIASGPVFHFGPVRVLGLKRYPERIVENFSPLAVGEPYDAEKLIIYQRRLLETGYFASVHIDIDTDPANAAAAPVRVGVIEGNTKRIDTGIGYSTDTLYRGQLTYTDVDLLGSHWRFKNDLRLDTKIQSFRIDFDSPPRSNGAWNNIFTSLVQTDIENQFTREFAAGVAHQWGVERTPSAVLLSGHVEEQRVAGSVTDNRHAVFLGYRKTFRDTDDLTSPRRGYLGTLTLGFAPPEVSTQQFARATFKLTSLFPVGRKNDLMLRGEVGVVVAPTRDGIPSTFLFRTGGDQTVRGYAFESIGVQQGDAIVGGRYLGIASAEFTHWIGEGWGLAAFVDVGDATDSRDTFKLNWGYGIGARVRSPIGPFRVDVAYGQEVHSFRLHFSVGYSF